MKVPLNKQLMTLALPALLLLALGAGLFRLARSPARLLEVDSGRLVRMGTFARIQLRCRDRQVGQQALAAAMTALDQVDRLMSTYRDDSELAQINCQAAEESVPVSRETYQLLQKSLEYSRMTDGAFDITAAPLVQLWRRAQREHRWPRATELAETIKKTGYQTVLLSPRPEPTVRFTSPGVQLDLNAIAKGYAVDQALAAVRQPGVMAALVDIGGEIACFGQNQLGRDWSIGIQDPFAPDNDNQLSEHPRWVIRLRDCAVATSGNYRRYLTIEGKKLSHIVDPRTGQPASKLPSVTIIAPTTMDADALATSVSVMGPESGMALIETIKDTEAFLVGGTPDKPKFYRSTGFSKFELQPMLHN